MYDMLLAEGEIKVDCNSFNKFQDGTQNFIIYKIVNLESLSFNLI